ncbi:hypothetical protein LTR75_018270, partial [Friedmanniomyces endolithicus]
PILRQPLRKQYQLPQRRRERSLHRRVLPLRLRQRLHRSHMHNSLERELHDGERGLHERRDGRDRYPQAPAGRAGEFQCAVGRAGVAGVVCGAEYELSF